MAGASYELYQRRWLMLALGFAINFVIFTIQQPLTPSAWAAAHYLDVSLEAIHWLKYAWSLAAVVAALPTLWIVERFGLKAAGVFATLHFLVGTILRASERGVSMQQDQKESTSAYVLVLIGSILAGAGAISMQSLTTFIAASWFDDTGRGFANTLVRYF